MIRRGIQVAAAIAVSACMTAGLRAAETRVAGGPMIQRSMRVVPRKFVISPSGATVAVNQTQHFGVLDSNGNPVAVRWNVSGLGCYGATCGSMDEDGVYHPPTSLPQPRVVTLEGVVVSDPRYSVLTEIRLEEDRMIAGSATKLAAKSAEERQLAAPEAPQDRDIASRVESLPTQRPVDATPTVQGSDAIRAMIEANRVPLPSAVSAAPPVQRQDIASRAGSMPVPSAVSNLPAVGSSVDIARAEPLPLPIVVGAAPMIAAQSMPRRTASPPTPTAVAAAPSVDGRPAIRTSNLTPIPSPVAAAPAPAAQELAGRVELVPVPEAVGASPTLGKPSGSRKSDLVPLPHAIAAPPPVVAQELPSKIELVSGPVVVTVAPKTEQRANSRPTSSPALTPSKSTPAVAQELPDKIELVSGPVVVTGLPKTEQRENIRTSNEPASSASIAAAIPAARVPAAPPPNAPTPAVAANLAFAQTAGERDQPVLMASRQVPDASPILRPMADESAKPPADLLPQNAARVIYRDGQLTIDAQNSTLAEVLNLVGQKTGATIEIPPGSGQDRIFEHAGPGKPNEVLTQLLNGSHFNFIIVNSPEHPENVARVLLSVEKEDNQTAAITPAVPNPATLPGMYKPSEEVGPQTLPPEYNTDLKVPTESLSPEARGDLMKEMIRKLGERAAQQAPPQ
ncbi:MAG: hypothetical protein WAL71_01510 [Terriglobales bacterium]